MSELYSVKLWIANPNRGQTMPTPANPFASEEPPYTYYLNVESINKQISRSPTVIALPELRRNASQNPGEPIAFPLDLGITNNDLITINGVTADTPSQSAEGTSVNPSIASIEKYVRTSWRFAQLSTGNGSSFSDFFQNPIGGPRITIPQAPNLWFTYCGLITNYKADRSGGQQYWRYSITFQVTSWPPVPINRQTLVNSGWPSL